MAYDPDAITFTDEERLAQMRQAAAEAIDYTAANGAFVIGIIDSHSGDAVSSLDILRDAREAGLPAADAQYALQSLVRDGKVQRSGIGMYEVPLQSE